MAHFNYQQRRYSIVGSFTCRLKQLSCCMIATVAVAGCTASLEGAPDRLLPIAAETEVAKKLASSAWYYEYATATGSRRRELRDQIVLARMYATDLYYSEYEARLTKERQSVGFYSTVASLALTSSATLVAANETKSILSALATGLTGTREAYDKEILIEKTITILQQQMRTRRKEVKVTILERLGRDTATYPLELALTDLESYYRAGTLTGALIDVSEATGFRLSEARRLEEEVVVTRFAPVRDLGQRIRAFARNNIAAVTTYLKNNHGEMPLAEFARNASPEDQLRMINKLKIP